MNKLFITLEGVEGAGKSTQIALLRDALQQRGYVVTTTREPGGHPVAEAIRALLLTSPEIVSPRTELLLFLAARAQHVDTVIKPALAQGHIVLCDRYTDSTVTYQGYARGLDIESIRTLNRIATDGLAPSLTIVLDMPVANGLTRQKDRNRMEMEPETFHMKVREGFLTEAAREPLRFRVVDADRPVEQVFQDIFHLVIDHLD